MYDPHSVAFEIRYPWPWSRMWKGGPRHSFITIWHVDPENPERGGGDDSCGWFRPRLTKSQREHLEFLGHCEAKQPWFKKERAKQPLNPSDAEALLRGALMATAQNLRLKFSIEELTELACDLLHDPIDNLRGSMCLLPGWHTNFKNEDFQARKLESEGFFCNLGALLLGRRRPWYKHPRYHFWHWSFQVHPWQTLRRWLFTQCAECGKQFSWGYSPISRSFDRKKLGWFQGEKGLYHHECSGGGAVSKVAEPKSVS